MVSKNDEYMLKAALYFRDKVEEISNCFSKEMIPPMAVFGGEDGNSYSPAFSFPGVEVFEMPDYDEKVQVGGSAESNDIPAEDFPGGGEDPPWAEKAYDNWAEAVQNRGSEARKIMNELIAYQEILIQAMKDYTEVDIENEEQIRDVGNTDNGDVSEGIPI